MKGPFVMFYDPVRKKDMPINAMWVTHAYAGPDVDGRASCVVVVGGNSLMLTVQGDIVEVYRQLRDAVGQE